MRQSRTLTRRLEKLEQSLEPPKEVNSDDYIHFPLPGEVFENTMTYAESMRLPKNSKVRLIFDLPCPENNPGPTEEDNHATHDTELEALMGGDATQRAAIPDLATV